ncbi:MAG TPA: hypothetical protein VFC31_12980 [Candidatus Limnocylindria bacterium]|nr:hypothetical protein [Candidatus Limnocylindria bacterium]
MRWLDVPLPLLRALYERIPMLAARESLRAATAVALGSGTLRRGAAASVWRELGDQAGLGPRRRVLRRPTRAELAAIGITTA